MDEQFTGSVMPTGWTTTAIQGSQAWLIQGSPFLGSPSSGNYAVFDDNALGVAVTPNESDLITPAMNCTGRTAVYLAYSHYWFGVEFTHGYVEISNNGGGSWTTLIHYEKLTKGSLAAAQDTVLNITAFAANQANVMIRFRYSDGSQAGRYWYIDDVRVYADPDVGVTALINPAYLNCSPSAYTTTETVTVEITNFGISSVSNIPLTCVVSNGTSATLTGTFVGPLLGGATATFTFATTVDMSADDYYDFLAYTSLGTDEYLFNDTLFDSRQQLVTTYPYFQDFNSSTAGWFSTGASPPLNGGRSFEHGSLPYLNGTQGNGDSWYCETTVSNNATYIWVESPIFDFSSLANPQLSFDIKHSLHSSDYFQVQYSTNGGTSWTQLGNNSTPNWYNGTNWWRNSYTTPVDTWTEVQQNLCVLAGQPCVQFRIYGRPYYSMPTYPDYHKFAFDNFKIDALEVSAMLQHYQHSDNKPINGWNYYRLKQVDDNNAYQYSSIIALYNGSEDVGLKIQPNPATEQFTFDYVGADLDADFIVEIIDVNGRKLCTKKYYPTAVRVQETINTKDFSPGVYFVKFSNGAVSQSRKLIIKD